LKQTSSVAKTAPDSQSKAESGAGQDGPPRPEPGKFRAIIVRLCGGQLLSREAVSRAARVSITRTLYHSLRHGGLCLVLRGTRLQLLRGSQICFDSGSSLLLGSNRSGPAPCSLYLGRNARMTVHGSVNVVRGTRIFVGDNAHLEIGPDSYINFDSSVSCFEYIRVGARCAIAWNTTILDANTHDLFVDGLPRPDSQPIFIEDGVWVGTGATILPGVTVGTGAVIAAGSVVTRNVPPGTLVAGNPARVVHENVDWRP